MKEAHCDHECDGEVCWFYRIHASYHQKPCPVQDCQYDSRTHPAKSEAVLDDAIKELKQLEDEYTRKMLNTQRETLQDEFGGRAKAYAEAWGMLEELRTKEREQG